MTAYKIRHWKARGNVIQKLRLAEGASICVDEYRQTTLVGEFVNRIPLGMIKGPRRIWRIKLNACKFQFVEGSIQF